jgi:hypothetical protein
MRQAMEIRVPEFPWFRRAASAIRWLARPRGSSEAVKDAVQAVLAGDHRAFSVRSRLAVLGVRRIPSVLAALGAATAHAKGEVDHAEASARFAEATQHPTFVRQPVDVLIAMETLARTCGLFAASFGVTQSIRRAIESQASRTDDHGYQLFAATASAHDGDAARARSWLDRAALTLSAEDSRVVTIGTYLDVWAAEGRPRRHALRARHPLEEEIARSAGGRGVLVYGPGPTHRLPETCRGDALVVRVMMPEVYAWDGASDLVGGRSDIAYMNYEAQQWLSGLDPDRRDDVLARFGFLVCKKTDAFIEGFAPGNMRLARSAEALFLSGSENTVPAIVFDLLSFMDEDITVVGTTFFASDVAYRDDSRRLRPKLGVTVDSQGRTGRPLERCAMLANHNALENRSIVRNLFLAGRVRGDADFTEVIGWSDRSYLEHLDAIYGVARI